MALVRYSRFPGGGHKSIFPARTISDLKEFYYGCHRLDFIVSLAALKAEARRVDPVSWLGIYTNTFRMQIVRLLRAWDVSWRRVTSRPKTLVTPVESRKILEIMFVIVFT